MDSSYLETEPLNIDSHNHYHINDNLNNVNDDDTNEVKVYKKRWYILFIFVLLCIGQGVIYNTWAPIQSTARAVYKWDSIMIDLMPALGCIAPCFTIIPLGWMMDVKGLRLAVLLAAGFQSLGAVLRCIPTGGNMTILTVLICLGQVLGTITAPVPLSGGVLLSATWFPSNERTTSTAIITAGSFSGNALSFIIGPLLVDDVGSIINLNSTQTDFYFKQINQLLYIEAGFMVLLFLIIILHFPAKPPLPPSWSSGIERMDTKAGFKSLFRNHNFLLLAVLYGASCGVYSGWCSVLGQNLADFGLGQRFAGWLGFIAVLSGAFSGVCFSVLAGHFIGRLKDFLVVFMAFASFSVLVVCFIFSKVIPFNTILICIIFGFTGFFINGALPFFFELGAEISYPVAEGITTSAIKFTDYFLQTLFLIVSMKQLGVRWMTWLVMVTLTGTTVMLYFVKEKYNRLNIDVRQDGLQH